MRLHPGPSAVGSPAVPHRGARGAEQEGSAASRAASSRFVHGLCSVPGIRGSIRAYARDWGPILCCLTPALGRVSVQRNQSGKDGAKAGC